MFKQISCFSHYNKTLQSSYNKSKILELERGSCQFNEPNKSQEEGSSASRRPHPAIVCCKVIALGVVSGHELFKLVVSMKQFMSVQQN